MCQSEGIWMNYRNERYTFSLAGPEHSHQLLEIYESGEFTGNISVLYTRRPDPFQSLMMEGESALIPIVFDREKNRVCAMGACIIRKVNLNGEIRTAGYLTGLKSLPEYRKRIPHGSEVYRYLYEQTKDKVDIYYTTILQDNVVAQKMLEKKRRNMPEYRYSGRYTVYCISTGPAQRRKERGREYNKYRFLKGNIAEVERFFQNASPRFNLSPVEMNWPGLTDEDCYTLRDSDGRIIAACALWSQQSYKQYLITEYRGIYRYLRKVPLELFGYPNLPKENQPVNYTSVTMLAVSDDDSKIATYFIEKVAEAAKSYDFAMLGLFENHPLTASVAGIRSIKYESRLYTVHWNDDSLIPDDKPVDLEVGLL